MPQRNENMKCTNYPRKEKHNWDTPKWKIIQATGGLRFSPRTFLPQEGPAKWCDWLDMGLASQMFDDWVQQHVILDNITSANLLMAKVDLTRVLAKCCMWLGYPTAKVQMSWWRLTIFVGVHSCNAKTQGALAGASGRIRHSLLFRPNGYQRVMHHLKMKNARFPRNCSFGIFCEFLLAFRIQVRNPNYQKILLRTRLQVYIYMV